MKRIIALVFIANCAHAQSILPKVDFGGSMQARSESLVRADFDDGPSTANKASSTSYRFRLDVKAQGPDDSFYFFLQPQFVKTAGKLDDSSNVTSGSTVDTSVNGHQAYIKFSLFPDFDLKIGRQELSYGDELIIGALPWNMTARSFDALKFQYQNLPLMGKLDLFASKIQDNNVTASNTPDYNFYGAYLASSPLTFMKEFDIYLFMKDQPTTANKTDSDDVYTLGTRVKSPVGSFDYRAEVIAQEGPKKSSQQYDGEIGYTFDFFKIRIAGLYFLATKNYDQHFPTAHKFLGWADLIGRRNIEGEAIRLSSRPIENLLFNIDYHMFNRQNTNSPAYKLNGTSSWGSVGKKRRVARELDTKCLWNFKKNLDLELGYMFAFADGYIKDQNPKATNTATFSYLQLRGSF